MSSMFLKIIKGKPITVSNYQLTRGGLKISILINKMLKTLVFSKKLLL